MYHIMNRVIRTATGRPALNETGFEREQRIRHADRIERQHARDELRRYLYSKISL